MNLIVPPVPELARLKGETKHDVAAALREYYEADSAPFNYISGTRSTKTAYKGFENLEQLKAGCAVERTPQGKKSNQEVVECAAPLAFGRKISVFDLPRRRFSFGRDHHSAYRVPFFFVENGNVKLYYLQPRKSSILTLDELCMIATIHKRFLLDTEFFGQPSDVEYVDVSAPPGATQRTARQYCLNDLPLWSESRLTDRLTLIAEALEFLQREGSVQPKKRRRPQPMADMPLFE